MIKINTTQDATTIGAAIMLLINTVIALFLGITWIFGFILAKGFWSTLFCLIPFYSFYLVIEHFALKFSLL